MAEARTLVVTHPPFSSTALAMAAIFESDTFFLACRVQALDYGVNLCFLQRLFTIHSMHGLLYFLKTFAGDGEPRYEVRFV